MLKLVYAGDWVTHGTEPEAGCQAVRAGRLQSPRFRMELPARPQLCRMLALAFGFLWIDFLCIHPTLCVAGDFTSFIPTGQDHLLDVKL